MPVIAGGFALAIAWGAALLFACQPMLTKLILPIYGGSPSVWATASFLFQLLLLVGYALVHLAIARLGRRQLWVQLVLVLLPLVALPVALPANAEPPAAVQPVGWLVLTLLVAIGLPFVVLAMTGPVLQVWYSWASPNAGRDPYVLYAASNAGSLIGLLSYPFLVEWALPLSAQARWWSIGYVGYVVLMLGCGLAVLASRSSSRRTGLAPTAEGFHGGADDVQRVEIGPRRRLRWLFWAFLPAAVSLAVTTHLTTDVAAIPFLWVMPLALYLLSFIVAFARRGRTVPLWPVLIATTVAISSLVLLVTGVQAPIELLVTGGLVLVFTVGLAGHSRLAADRPPVADLTGFYLIVSTGGFLGGLLNGVLAPLVLNGPWEYPLLLGLIPLLAAGQGIPVPRARFLGRLGTPGWVLEVLVASGALAAIAWFGFEAGWAALVLGILGVLVAVLGLLSAVAPRAPVAFTCVLLSGLAVLPILSTEAVWRERTFFGSYRVVASDDRNTLIHGTTIHGWQLWADGTPDLTPTSYYTRTGPLGDVLGDESAPPRSLGFVGLGIGTALSYVRPSDTAEVVEIDPAVVDVARDTRWFTFLDEAEARTRVHVGDGRLVLEQELGKAEFDVLVVDAFSSDAIPVHLLTREAVELYLDRVVVDGIVVMHVTNRHLELEPIVASLAEDAGVAAASSTDDSPAAVAARSTWVALARGAAPIDRLVAEGWSRLDGGVAPVWTDDYSSVLGALR